MNTLLAFTLLLIGLIVLIKGADFLVDGASGIARKLRVPEIIIGMTIIVLGTSAPEIFVALNAFAGGDTDLILGDVIGCAIADIFLLLGISALIRPVKIRRNTADVEIPFYVFLVFVFVIMILYAFFTDGEINRVGGVILLLLYAISFFLTLFVSGGKERKKTTRSARSRRKALKKERKTWVYALLLFGGLSAVVIGSHVVVNSAREVALAAGISERVIAIGIVAIGTCLPELTAAIFASKRGEQDLIIGSSLGSNIFDICIVLGLPILIYGGLKIQSFSVLDLAMVATASIILFLFTKEDRKISRKEGFIMVMIFALYYIVTFLLG